MANTYMDVARARIAAGELVGYLYILRQEVSHLAIDEALDDGYEFGENPYVEPASEKNRKLFASLDSRWKAAKREEKTLRRLGSRLDDKDGRKLVMRVVGSMKRVKSSWRRAKNEPVSRNLDHLYNDLKSAVERCMGA